LYYASHYSAILPVLLILLLMDQKSTTALVANVWFELARQPEI